MKTLFKIHVGIEAIREKLRLIVDHAGERGLPGPCACWCVRYLENRGFDDKNIARLVAGAYARDGDEPSPNITEHVAEVLAYLLSKDVLGK